MREVRSRRSPPPRLSRPERLQRALNGVLAPELVRGRCRVRAWRASTRGSPRRPASTCTGSTRPRCPIPSPRGSCGIGPGDLRLGPMRRGGSPPGRGARLRELLPPSGRGPLDRPGSSAAHRRPAGRRAVDPSRGERVPAPAWSGRWSGRSSRWGTESSRPQRCRRSSTLGIERRRGRPAPARGLTLERVSYRSTEQSPSFDGGAFPQVAWAVGLSGRHLSDEDLLAQA